jgi:flavodoxin
MKIIVVYDSVFGNTGQIAQAIGGALGSGNEVEVCNVSQFSRENLKGTELLIVGSPTRGFRPTEAISNFIKNLSPRGLTGIMVAAFDTRISLEELKSSIARFIVKKGGYAANPIAKKLVAMGGILMLPPEGFLVTNEKGPLKVGETERAAGWARELLKATLP